MNTVNHFIKGYCDELRKVDIFGCKGKDSDCTEVVDITSDDSFDEYETELTKQEIDDSDVGKALLSYIEGKEELSVRLIL